MRYMSPSKDHLSLTGKCHFCATRPPDAFWSLPWWNSEQHIEICRFCAVDVLPKLLADAITNDPPISPRYKNVRHVQQNLDPILKNFWYAIALNMGKEEQKP